MRCLRASVVARWLGAVLAAAAMLPPGRAMDRNVLVLDGKVTGIRTRPLTTGLDVTAFTFSPNGRHIAYLELHVGPPDHPTRSVELLDDLPDPQALRQMLRSRLGVLSVRTAQVRTLLTLPEQNPDAPLSLISPEGVAWSADERFLVVTETTILPQPGGRVLVTEVRTGRRWASPAYQVVKGAAWHPRRPLLAYAARAEMEALDQVFLWEPGADAPQYFTEGRAPQWTADGWLAVTRGRAEQRVEVDPLIGTTRPARSVSSPSPLVLEGGDAVSRLRSAEGAGFRVETRRVAHRPRELVIRWTQEGDKKELTAYDSRGEERLHGFTLSPEGALLAYLVRRTQRQPTENIFKLDVYDLWLFAPHAPARSNTAWVATFKAPLGGSDPQVQWAPAGRRLAYVSGGDLFVVELEDWSYLPFTIVNGEPLVLLAERATTKSNLRQIALAALMFANDNDEFPDGARIQEELQPYLRVEENLYGRLSDPQSYLLEWLMPGGIRISDIERPAETPLAIMAWPPGEVQVAFVDGHIRGFTDSEWQEFIERAEADGRWPPDW